MSERHRILAGLAAVIVVGAAIAVALGAVLTSSDSARPSKAEIERFGRVTLPADTHELRARIARGPRQSMSVRFSLERSDLDAFVRSTGLPLRSGYKSYPFNELGWHLDRIRDTLGADEKRGNYARTLVIDLDKPQSPTVYLVAGTA